jgi:ribosomal protein S6--L-glutamate ligase
MNYPGILNILSSFCYSLLTMRVGILSAEANDEDIRENKRLVREIRLKGHKAQIINYRKTVLVTTKNRKALYQPNKNGVLQKVRVKAVLPRINEADEQSINLATLALEALVVSGVYSTVSPSSIRLAKNKIGSLMALVGAGVNIPRSAAITGTESYAADIDKVLKIVEPNQNRRLIVKTNTGTHGKGVMSAGTRGDARAIVDGFLANNIPVLVQQFVEPTKKGHYTDLRFVVVNGKVVATMKRLSARRDEIRANISLGGRGIAYRPSEHEIEMAEKAAKAIGLSVAGVDIIPSGKSRMIIEVNASPGFAIEEICKVNIAKKIVQMAIAGGRKGETTASERLVAKINTPINLKPLPAMPKTIASLKKIKFAPKLAEREL